jgi:AcrR family transcriptional regulator
MMPAQPDPDFDAPRPGRPRDASRDVAILAAAISILAETGFERMTMEMVAVRAKAGKGALYRRWSSKQELVLEAVAQMKRDQVDLDNLPDTGSLRGDMLALFRAASAEEAEHKRRAIAGLATLLGQAPSLADATSEALTEPWIHANRVLMQRAIDRGEIDATAPVKTLVRLIPSLGGYRSIVERKPFDHAFLVEMLDCILLPALGIPVPGDGVRPKTAKRR